MVFDSGDTDEDLLISFNKKGFKDFPKSCKKKKMTGKKRSFSENLTFRKFYN